MKNQLFVGILSLVVMAGCNQDPYTTSVKPWQKIVGENTPNGQEVPRAYSIEGPVQLVCTEGSTCQADYVGHVPNDAEVIFSTTALPKGASFNTATGTFTFTPGFDFVDVGAHPESSEENADFVITLMSSIDHASFTTLPVSVIVKNKLQPLDLNVNGAKDLKEGALYEEVLEVQNNDFANGPFNLSLVNAPGDAKLTPVAGNPKQFKFSYTPAYNTVKLRDGSSKLVPLTFLLSAPLGQTLKKDISFNVQDVRKEALVTTADNVTIDIDNTIFAIRAEDLNGDKKPEITVYTKVPFGKITTVSADETAQAGENPSSMQLVKWDQLYPSAYGTTTEIYYDVCVQKNSYGDDLCTQRKVTVTLKKGARHQEAF